MTARRSHRPAEAGFIIFGGRRTVKQLGIVRAQCPNCGQVAALRLMHSRRWFTLFFLPVVPLGGRHIVTCTYCGASYAVPAEVMQGLLAGPQQALEGAPPQALPQGQPPPGGQPVPPASAQPPPDAPSAAAPPSPPAPPGGAGMPVHPQEPPG